MKSSISLNDMETRSDALEPTESIALFLTFNIDSIGRGVYARSSSKGFNVPIFYVF